MQVRQRLQDLTRREFLAAGASTAVLLPSNPLHAFISAGRARERGMPLQEFEYGDVGFFPGPHEAQLKRTHEVLMGLDENSLLRPFRMAAGIAAPGNDLGGWYSAPRFLGETFGQWISGLSRYYAATADQPTREKVERLLGEYARTIDGSDKLFELNGNPVYFHDKLTLGITDAAQFAGHEPAKTLLSRLMDNSKVVLKKKASTDLYREGKDLYNYAETYFMASAVCGDSRFFELARRDLNDGFLEPVSLGKNVLARRHAYSHINALCGAAKAYLVLGEEKYLDAAINGLAFAEQQSLATGTYSSDERFLPQPDFDYTHEDTGEKKHIPAVTTLADSLLHGHHHFEAGCNSYAHFKLTRYLLRITQNAQYGDSMERIMYNAALGMKPLSKFGKAFYQSDYSRRARKQYFDGYDNRIEDEWPCCSGTLAQLTADYRISTYFQDAKGVFVNLYIPSTLKWSQDGLDIFLTQAGAYPLSDTVTFTVELIRAAAFALRLRIPAWTKEPAVRVNGASIGQLIKPGTFHEVRRKWRSGDRVELVLPKRLELKAIDDQHPDMAALCCGPMVLFAIGEGLPRLTRQKLLSARQVTPGASEWYSGEVRFLPWWIIKDETYTTYHDVS